MTKLISVIVLPKPATLPSSDTVRETMYWVRVEVVVTTTKSRYPSIRENRLAKIVRKWANSALQTPQHLSP